VQGESVAGTLMRTQARIFNLFGWKWLSLVCAVFLCTQVLKINAQKQIANQHNAWVAFFGNHRINKHWGFNTEYQWRRSGFIQHWQQSLLRCGVDFYSASGAKYSVGYAWIKTFPYGAQPIAHENNEHRIWQQAELKSTLTRTEIFHRYRLEQRYIENWVNSSENTFQLNGFSFRQRARYRLLCNVPLNKCEMSDHTLFLSVWDEIFVGFGEGIAKNVLDQNRLYCALGWRFNTACNIQLGYLNQYVIKKDGIQTERNHTLQAAITYNLDWRKNGE
jgi:hypothetical protein